MDSKQVFEKFYREHPEKHFSKSLLHFFEAEIRKRLPEQPAVLELGCGNYSLFEELKLFSAEIMAIDFSAEAISQTPASHISYLQKSATDTSFFTANRFDLIFDSHCMNCIVDEEERNLALKNIHQALKADGFFAGELMVQPIDKSVSMPFKRIKTADELEQEILDHQFRIIYFMIGKDSFVNEVNGEEIICDVLRVIAKKTS